MPDHIEAVRDWLLFFRDIGVTDLSVRLTAPAARPEPPTARRAVVARPRPAVPAACGTAVRSFDAGVTASGSSAQPAPAEPPAGAPCAPESLAQIRADLGDCRRCKLHAGRHNIVFGAGPENAELVFVGEAPGETEDLEGVPFVGRAGELLTRMIAAMGYSREEVYIANVVKCRPPDNRNPEPDEIAACRPFLEGQLDRIRPRAIVALGGFAAQALTGLQVPISALRGKFRDFRGIPLMPTYHPAYLIRSPAKKREVWQDLQQVMKLLGRPLPPGSSGPA
ncbi:MAG: uracil-DNA glycosylase [Acidobacteriota bacterium]